MREVIGKDIFDQISEFDAICITTNCSLDDQFNNMMGGGLAGAAANRWPLLPEIYGKLLMVAPDVPVILGWTCRHNSLLFCSSLKSLSADELINEPVAVVAFPTMHSIMEPASLDLVKRSATLLVELAFSHDWKKISIGRPGAGIGGLDWESQVKPAIEEIFDYRFSVFHK